MRQGGNILSPLLCFAFCFVYGVGGGESWKTSFLMLVGGKVINLVYSHDHDLLTLDGPPGSSLHTQLSMCKI